MKTDAQKEIQAVRKIALQELDALTDAELLAEVAEDGESPQVLSADIAARLDDVIAQVLRDRAASAKANLRSKTPASPIWRPAIDRIKELIDQAFGTDPRLAAAYREGTRQSDLDLESLYDDLVSMGKIKPDHGPR